MGSHGEWGGGGGGGGGGEMKGQNYFFSPVDSLVLERLLYGISWGGG